MYTYQQVNSEYSIMDRQGRTVGIVSDEFHAQIVCASLNSRYLGNKWATVNSNGYSIKMVKE